MAARYRAAALKRRLDVVPVRHRTAVRRNLREGTREGSPRVVAGREGGRRLVTCDFLLCFLIPSPAEPREKMAYSTAPPEQWTAVTLRLCARVIDRGEFAFGMSQLRLRGYPSR